MMILLITQDTADPHSAFTLKVLSIVGAVGFAYLLSLAKSLQTDIEALQEASRFLTTDQ